MISKKELEKKKFFIKEDDRYYHVKDCPYIQGKDYDETSYREIELKRTALKPCKKCIVLRRKYRKNNISV